MTLPLPRPVIEAMPRYVPGSRGSATGPTPIKLSSNETALPTLPEVAAAASEAAAGANRYPDMFSADLTGAIAAWQGVRPGQVAVGGGSVAILSHIIQAFCDQEDEVIFAWRSFEAYPILAQVAGAIPVRVPLGLGARHHLPAMADAVTDRTKVIFLCSPNNPTGTAIHAQEFEDFMAAVPPHVLVVVDEAYVEFVRDPDVLDSRAALVAYPNVLVTRTFSKAWGLAGLRVGYAMGHPDIIAAVRACVTPFSVNAAAQAGALAALKLEAVVLERAAAIVEERERVVAALAAGGWEIPDSQGNFVWIEAHESAVALGEHLAAAAVPILARPFDGDGVRITIGSPEDNDAMLARLAEYPDRF